jgi:hypothetical protein
MTYVSVLRLERSLGERLPNGQRFMWSLGECLSSGLSGSDH